MNLKLKSKIVETYGSQADFAIAAGVGEPFVSRVVRERKSLSEEQQNAWAALLDCSMEDLFINENQQNQSIK